MGNGGILQFMQSTLYYDRETNVHEISAVKLIEELPFERQDEIQG